MAKQMDTDTPVFRRLIPGIGALRSQAGGAKA
jgi:hypothetical protein